MDSPGEQIFVDGSGRRRRWAGRAALAVSGVLVGYLVLLSTGVVTSSPMGTPPWIAEEEPHRETPAATASATPSATATARPSTSAPPSSARQTAADERSAPAHATEGAPAPATQPAPAPGQATGNTRATKAPVDAPGQTRRPEPGNTRGGGR